MLATLFKPAKWDKQVSVTHSYFFHINHNRGAVTQYYGRKSGALKHNRKYFTSIG